MRVTTRMIFATAVGTMQRQSASLLHTQQQLATGRRMLSAADDPVAAARALDVTQARGINAQHLASQDAARSALAAAEGALTGAQDVIVSMETRLVQAGNATLSRSDLASIAQEMRSGFEQLLGIANSTDASGAYQFSGYQAGTRPFSGTVEAGVQYHGDDGIRALQVSGSRELPVGLSGADAFARIRNGNGAFATSAASANTGTGTIDGGSLLAGYDGHRYTLSFAAGAGGLEYSVADFDPVSGTTTPSGPFAYQAGAPIALGAGAIEVTVSGTPAAGDTFTVAPSTQVSIFDTLGSAILALESATTDAAGRARLTNSLQEVRGALSQSLDKVLAARALVGSRLGELDALSASGEDLRLQYEAALSKLQDVDYAEAISRLTQEQTSLEASQKSFLQVSQLSLFKFL
ncbi:MAG TPA: flagellar hook-associated protein 3 [Rhodocyclaceae bacterium]|nr:MAG: flagellar hook-associated protein 3 [Betaproteobacteria bacterium CG2_30_68_42]PIV71587.1 MAG: flagellar hook-associated protein 3 [Rhodocyclales bacterium CG17_big_fil_post_rev_8_21_14_2_50_68_7]PJA56972.1 MAG: flagellar hook-associated protein 3 [Rhodocyclales bacterium CG_4_9_14_3_um_filter_68_10]HCX32966.1 flagellar hook-associated protein 3 [Rhodocyclaceae bacterium]